VILDRCEDRAPIGLQSCAVKDHSSGAETTRQPNDCLHNGTPGFAARAFSFNHLDIAEAARYARDADYIGRGFGLSVDSALSAGLTEWVASG
jgi:hypothetical protein